MVGDEMDEADYAENVDPERNDCHNGRAEVGDADDAKASDKKPASGSGIDREVLAPLASPASTPRTALPTPSARHSHCHRVALTAATAATVPVVEVMIHDEAEAEAEEAEDDEEAERMMEMEMDELEDEDEEEEEEPKPRSAMPSMMLERAVEAAADATAAAEAATDVSFEEAVEALSPAKEKQTETEDPSNYIYSAAAVVVPPPLAHHDEAPAAAAPAVAPSPGVSMAEDKLASILSYLDTVEQTNNTNAVVHDSAAWETGSVSGSLSQPQYQQAHGTVHPVSVAPPPAPAALAAPVQAGPPLLPLRASSSPYTVMMPPPSMAGDSVNGDAMTVASSAGALATATTVYEGVKARMDALKKDVSRRDALVTKLEAELRGAHERMNQQLAEQRANHDAATQRHLNFADRLLADKDELAAKCADLGDAIAATEARHASNVQELKTAWAAELKRHKSAWEAAERSKREAWEADKTREVKELTIRGLEPEVQRLVQKHRGEIRDLQEAHREDLRRQTVDITQRHEEYVRSLRERMVRDHEDELEKERLAAAARSREQAERYEAQLHQQRQRAVADAEAAAERVEAGRREERIRHEEAVARLNLEAQQREERAQEQAAAAAEAARRRHDADLAALQGRLDDESAAWRAKVAAKAQEALAEKEREIRSKAAAERDAEIEAVAERLRAEADADRRRQTGALADRHSTETREAKERAEKAERAMAAAARAESAANERAAAAEAELVAVKQEAAARRDAAQFLEAQVSNYDEKSATRERDLRAAFEDRLRALEGAAAAAEKRAVAAEADLGRARERKDEEVAALEARVRAAIGRKDEAIAQLNAQLAAAQQQLAATEAVLQQQQQDMALMMGGGGGD